jgi:photosystem II stability/assembly factor-like uncharacterized protein
MVKRATLVISSAAIAAALTTQSGCAPCTCREPAPLTPGTSAAAAPGQPAQAAAAGGGGAGAGATVAGTVKYKWRNVTVLGGGFVSGIVFSAIEKDLVYARTDVGGAYRWSPADKAWVPLTDHLGRDSNFYGIESLAADPVDANKVYLAAGTYTGSWVGNGAILRSSDRGNTWTAVDMPVKMGGNENGRSMGERLAIDPNLPSVLFFGSRKGGLWKSADSGATWQKVAGFTATDGDKGIGIELVMFDKASGDKGKATPTVYAAVASNEGSLYRSTDAGATWKLVPGQPKGMVHHAQLDGKGVLYVSYGNGPGPNDITDGSVWKLAPKAEKGTDITPAAPTADDKFGYGGLSVDAAHPGTLMVSTIDRWSKGDDIYRSTDGGKTWKALLPKVVRDDAGAKYLYWHKDEPIGRGWMGDIDIDPFNPARVMYVTGAGVWATEDATAADTDKPTHWTFLDRGLEETVIKALVSPPSGPPLLSAMGDLCGFRHDDLGAPTAGGMFDNPLCGSASGIDVAWTKPEIVARAGWPDWTGKGPWGATSADGGKTWTPFKTAPKQGKGAGSIAVSADGSSLVYAPFQGPVAFSKDGGATWTRADGLPDAEVTPDWAPVPFRPAADRVNPKKFYVLDAKGGQAYRSDDGGAHFTASPTGLPNLPDYQFSSASAQATPGIEGDVWLTNFKELNHSTDGGKSYEAVSSVTEAYALGFGKAPEGKAYPALYLIGKIGDVTGFFRSDDAGAKWVRINDDQHQYGFCTVIIGDPRVYGRVYVGTGGRGIVYGEPM